MILFRLLNMEIQKNICILGKDVLISSYKETQLAIDYSFKELLSLEAHFFCTAC